MKRFLTLVCAGVSQAYDKLFPNVLKKRTWWPVFLVGIFLISIVSVTTVSAIDFTTILGWVARVFASLLLELAKLCIFLAIFFLRFFITLASYNNYIDVSVVRLGWVMVRDVANMFFIVGLLVIAFATILGLERYEWKRGLVKIVMMAILINFSNLIAQLVIDVAHVFTITFLNAVSATAGGNLINLFQFDKILGLVSGNALGTSAEQASFSIFAASVMSFLFALLAALTIGAYLLTMMARIVVLWALIILSPLAFMLYALPKGEDYAREWWNEFSKHVIVAPIMVFFLWLAFATFGTGQIISEIQSQPNVIKVNATGEEQQSVSILEITTWENMASFLLGIAFLWVGIKKTQDTGAMGSGLIGGAVDFTKKVATIATGYAAGRWLVGKAGDAGEKGIDLGISGLKGAGMRLGGAHIKEFGAGIKARYEEGRVRSKIAKSERAKTLEEKGGAWNKIKARFIEPHERALKRAEDWKEGAERLKKIQEESYSTSASKAGQFKLGATVEMKAVEARSEAKRAAKVATRSQQISLAVDVLEKMVKETGRTEKDLLNDKTAMQTIENQVIGEMAKLGNKEEAKKLKAQALEKMAQETGRTEEDLQNDKTALQTIENQVIGEMVKTDKGAGKLKALMDRDGGITALIADGKKVREIYGGAIKEKAVTEDINVAMRRSVEASEAIERDKIRVANNLTPIYEQAVAEKHAKEKEEERSGLNYREYGAQAFELAQKLTRAVGDPKLQEELVTTISGAMKKGSETGMNAVNKALEALGFDNRIDADDMLGHQRKVLSLALGENITKDKEGNLEEYFNKFISIHGEKKGMAILRNLDTGSKVTAADGGLNMAGVFDDTEVVNGRIKFKLKGMMSAEQKKTFGDLKTEEERSKFKEDLRVAAEKDFKDSRDYFAEEINLTKLTGIEDMVNKDASGKKATFRKLDGSRDERALKQMLLTFSSLKQNTRLHSRNVTSLRNLDSKENREDMNEFLQRLNEEAREALLTVLDRELDGSPRVKRSKSSKPEASPDSGGNISE